MGKYNNEGQTDRILLSIIGILIISIISFLGLGMIGGFYNWDLLSSPQLLAFGISSIVVGFLFVSIGVRLGWWGWDFLFVGFRLIGLGILAILRAIFDRN
ncbi:MAG: hypothetical protein GY870_08320 [archaeon]|nr:hypothetical protein [archaeon]